MTAAQTASAKWQPGPVAARAAAQPGRDGDRREEKPGRELLPARARDRRRTAAAPRRSPSASLAGRRRSRRRPRPRSFSRGRIRPRGRDPRKRAPANGRSAAAARASNSERRPNLARGDLPRAARAPTVSTRTVPAASAARKSGWKKPNETYVIGGRNPAVQKAVAPAVIAAGSARHEERGTKRARPAAERFEKESQREDRAPVDRALPGEHRGRERHARPPPRGRRRGAA